VSDSASSYSIVAVDRFIQATRDSGYKGTKSAIAELVDNSLQAGAEEIGIDITSDRTREYPVEIRLTDDGGGMAPDVLRQSLQFGGSSRFDDRSGLGRFGMGLPNASLSQARQVVVTTWTSASSAWQTSLDVDEIAAGAVVEVPEPRQTARPTGVQSESGTSVVWRRCDRLDNRRPSTIARKLHASLGRRFRYFLLDGVRMTINGEAVEPLDPLFLDPACPFPEATPFSGTRTLEVSARPDGGPVGQIHVRFSELPVAKWSNLSNKEKRRRGITKGAGISVVRGMREVDYGWFFLSGKRRENYDDWWRCEVRFDPVLDEAFGITHTKQQIRPQAHVLEALSPTLEQGAKALARRVRDAHQSARLARRFEDAERIANEREAKLPPLAGEPAERDRAVLARLSPPVIERKGYVIHRTRGVPTRFFDHARTDEGLVLVLHQDHVFYRRVYGPLLQSEDKADQALATHLELVLLSAARTQASIPDLEPALSERLMGAWSDTLATYLA